MAPDGSRVAFVRQLGDRSELAVIGLDGRGQADLTRSAPGVEWSRPRWNPDGRAIAAARLLPTGELDIVLVDADGANLRALTSDRAKDVEPAWTPDGKRIVFRSDRDGVSNLYAVSIDDGTIVRLTNVVGGAFAPDVAPDGGTVAFSNYRAAGYDVHVMPLDLPAAPVAAPFVDPYPPSRPTPAEYAGADRPYRPLSALVPRFWTPYFEGGDEFKLGAATGGTDPLFRHAYGAALEHGFDTGRLGFHGFYQYDRWLPTLLLTYEDQSDPTDAGAVSRIREVNVRATVPVERKLRRTQSLSIAWRRSRDTIEETTRPTRSISGGSRRPGTLTTARQYRIRFRPPMESRSAWVHQEGGSALEATSTWARRPPGGGDLRAYHRVFPLLRHPGPAPGRGNDLGEPFVRPLVRRGGIPRRIAVEVVQTNTRCSAGTPRIRFAAGWFAHANAEYRFPSAPAARASRPCRSSCASSRRGLRDAANAWSGPCTRRGEGRCGGRVGMDLSGGPGLSFTLTPLRPRLLGFRIRSGPTSAGTGVLELGGCCAAPPRPPRRSAEVNPASRAAVAATGSEVDAVTVMMTGTAWPFSVVGL